MAKGQPCWATHTQHLCTLPSEHARMHWRHPAAQRPMRWQGWTLTFSLEAKYLLSEDTPLPAGLCREAGQDRPQETACG